MAAKTSGTMAGLIRCPPYCRSNCTIKHHPLLVALLNCRDTDDQMVMNLRIHDLNHVVTIYRQRGWKIMQDIPDAMESYRMPLGHWACNLGRIRAMEWLVDNGFPPETKSRLSGDTCLHRALIRLLESCPRDASHKFQQLLQVLHPALSVGNNFGNTALHICCDMLQKGMPRRDFYARAVTHILAAIQSQPPEVADLLLNAQNNEEDTPLHLLAKAGGSLSSIQQLVTAGCEVDLHNTQGMTPIEIAVKNAYLKTAMYLDSVLRSQGHKHKLVAYMKKIRDDKGKTKEKEKSRHKEKEPAVSSVDKVLRDLDRALGKASKDESNSFGKRPLPSPEDSSVPESKRQKRSEDAEQESASKEPERVGIMINMQVPTAQSNGEEGPGTASMAISITDEGEGLLSFLGECEERLREHILVAISKARDQSVETHNNIKEKNTALLEKLDAHVAEQQVTVEQVQKLLDRLWGLQREEAQLRTQLIHVQKEVGTSTFNLNGLRERLGHCEAALSALGSIK